MNKKEKALFILSTLEKLFPNPSIPLSHTDSYTLLIAVLLSAQSTDARVNLITPILFAKANTPQEMIKLAPEEIESIIRPCGLGSTKAKAIWHLSKMLIDNYQGIVPGPLEELEKLPGVGHKTASVVLIQAFGIPAFPVDTHIHRCAKRWGLSKGVNVVQTENDLKKLFPKDTWIKLHLQMIYFARTYCQARGHLVEKCPICRVIAQKESVP
jgi:endonuclease III